MTDADEGAEGAEGADVLLGRQVRSGLAWSLLNNGVAHAGTTVTGIVLARILAPEDFGVYAVALVVYMAVLSVNELGVSLAVVRWTGDVAAIAPTVATIALGSSILMYAVCFVAAPGLASGLGRTHRHQHHPGAVPGRARRRYRRHAHRPDAAGVPAAPPADRRSGQLRGRSGREHPAGLARCRCLESGVGPLGGQRRVHPGHPGPESRPDPTGI